MYPIMEYPDTVEEFMEQYKVTDSNGVDFVPIFRMRQWFAHELQQGLIEEIEKGQIELRERKREDE